SVLAVILAILLYNLFFSVIPASRTAEETGRTLGEDTGRKVGTYTGSAQGIKTGISESRDKEHKADEIAARLTKIAGQTGEMYLISEVIPANSYVITDEDADEPVENQEKTAFLTHDLSQEKIKITGENLLSITLPEPEYHVYSSSDESEIDLNVQPSESLNNEAKEIAVSEVEKIADTVCGKTFKCSVSFGTLKGGDGNE
ncbi:MAG: hypothetical protein ILP22_08350, partial [Oscillospiraceae bacterium]|nr:hypothetical protein [Oscillospiraceae bacterium]